MRELPKLVITDIDGVWTDGGMYYDQTGNEWKKFNTSDSVGVLICHKLNIPVAIITGENTEIVKRRASKLNIDYLYEGIKNKYAVAIDLCRRLKIDLKSTAFIGDDIGDYELLRTTGISGAPKNSSKYIRRKVLIKCKKNGGEGAFREFVEKIVGKRNVEKLLLE